MSCSRCGGNGQTELSGMMITCPGCRGFGHDLKTPKFLGKEVNTGVVSSPSQNDLFSALEEIPKEKYNIKKARSTKRAEAQASNFHLMYGPSRGTLGADAREDVVARLKKAASQERDALTSDSAPGAKELRLSLDYNFIERKILAALLPKAVRLKALPGEVFWTVLAPWHQQAGPFVPGEHIFIPTECKLNTVTIRESDICYNGRPPEFVLSSKEEAQALCDQMNLVAAEREVLDLESWVHILGLREKN